VQGSAERRMECINATKSDRKSRQRSGDLLFSRLGRM
jgi:hypothetical protein